MGDRRIDAADGFARDSDGSAASTSRVRAVHPLSDDGFMTWNIMDRGARGNSRAEFYPAMPETMETVTKVGARRARAASGQLVFGRVPWRSVPLNSSSWRCWLWASTAAASRVSRHPSTAASSDATGPTRPGRTAVPSGDRGARRQPGDADVFATSGGRHRGIAGTSGPAADARVAATCLRF